MQENVANAHTKTWKKEIFPFSSFHCKKVPRWNASDDAKLKALWQAPYNNIDLTKIDKELVKALHQKHVSHMKYENFALLYCS